MFANLYELGQLPVVEVNNTGSPKVFEKFLSGFKSFLVY